ncbi:MAG: protein ImuA [Alphaproteobacteria bacterium]|nr:protein ImuA [Alphaproteobacteria bacterium]
MPALSSSRTERLAALRVEVRTIESQGRRDARDCLPFAIEDVDRRLAGGGLAGAALHEIAGARPGLSDEAAACLFIAGLAARRMGGKGTVLWALKRRDLFAPGLAQAGLAPDRLIYAECGCDEDVLAVMEDGLRHGGLAAVVGETGRAAMASTRRLQLAAEDGGTIALMLRRWRRNGEDPLGLPSAAATRWRIGCVPSAALPVPGVGRPRWQVALVRQRGGEPFEWILESPDAEGRLALPAHAFDGSAAAGERRAA